MSVYLQQTRPSGHRACHWATWVCSTLLGVLQYWHTSSNQSTSGILHKYTKCQELHLYSKVVILEPQILQIIVPIGKRQILKFCWLQRTMYFDESILGCIGDIIFLSDWHFVWGDVWVFTRLQWVTQLLSCNNTWWMLCCKWSIDFRIRIWNDHHQSLTLWCDFTIGQEDIVVSMEIKHLCLLMYCLGTLEATRDQALGPVTYPPVQT